MPGQGRPERFHLGFLTAVELPERGFVGGLLVTNHIGRPLEFQCTTPVKPNRTQELLYGPTLRPFVLGELIGKTLVDRVGVKPDLVLVDDDEMLTLREHVVSPVAKVDAATAADDGDDNSDNTTKKLGKQRLRLDGPHAPASVAMPPGAEHVPDEADLTEPFHRVRAALEETLKGMR